MAKYDSFPDLQYKKLRPEGFMLPNEISSKQHEKVNNCHSLFTTWLEA
jgi:hypothetical protein